MSLFNDLRVFAEIDLAARKALNGGSFTKLDGEVELTVGEGLTAFDPAEDVAASVPFEADQGEDWSARAEADQIIACGDAGWDLADARAAATEREEADAERDEWQESRYLIA